MNNEICERRLVAVVESEEELEGVKKKLEKLFRKKQARKSSAF